MKRYLLVGATIFGLTLVLASPVAAQSPLPTPSAVTERVCQAVEKRVDARMTNFDNNKARHQQQHRQMQQRFKEITTKLEAAGYDTTQLKADGKKLDEMIIQFGQDYAAFITQLKTARQFPCGQSQGQFKTEMDEARGLLKKVHEDSKAIREFWRTTIKADIQALREQKNTSTTTN